MENNNSNVKKIFLILFIILICVSLFSSVYFYGSYKNKIELKTAEANKRIKNESYHDLALLNNDPSGLQGTFVEDVKNGINDKYTKSDAYFITHRFFDNGGNIYELYDYVNSHQELAFLKEAEAIYPGIFKQLAEKKVPAHPCDRAMYAYLAYVEVLRKHGYTDIAAVGTLANQYANFAYFLPILAKDLPKKEAAVRLKNVKRDTKKALTFIKAANEDVTNILNGKITGDDVTPRDILVGLNQYAAALRYLEASGISSTTIKSTKNSDEIFAFTMEYSYKNVPILYHFTSLLNASTLAILDSSQPEEIKKALYPFLDLDLKKNKLAKGSIVQKVLDSKLEKNWQILSEAELGMYGKRNTLILAKKVPEFKKWLISNGWVEADFK